MEGSNFPNLPDNVAKKVLRYLSSEEQKRFRIVSKKWNEIIQSIHPKLRGRMWVTDVNYEDELAKLSKNPFCKRIDFISFSKPLQCPVQPDFDHIERIGFRGNITQHNLIRVLYNCPGLKSLYFQNMKLPDEIMAATADLSYIKLPNLEEMTVTCSLATRSLTKDFSSDEKKLLDFLARLDYGGLLTFKCFCCNKVLDNMNVSPLFTKSELRTTNFFKFILKHKSTLINITLGAPEQSLSLILAKEFNQNEGNPLQLESITGLYRIPESFDVMFRAQNNLKTLKLVINSWQIIRSIDVALAQSSQSMTTIEFEGTELCASYSSKVSCPNLLHLSLRFRWVMDLPFLQTSTKLKSLRFHGPTYGVELMAVTLFTTELETLIFEDVIPTEQTKQDDAGIMDSISVELVEALFVTAYRPLQKLTTLCFKNCTIDDWDQIFDWCHQTGNISVTNLYREGHMHPDGLLIQRHIPQH